MKTRLLVIGVLNVLALFGGQALRILLSKSDPVGNSPVVISIAAVGIITLFGLLSATDANTKVTTRFAIAVSSVTVWFAVVGSLLFYAPKNSEGEFVDVSPTLADEALQTVSVAVGVILAFYFGAQAYQAVAGRSGAVNGTDSDPASPSIASAEGRQGNSANGPDDRELYD